MYVAGKIMKYATKQVHVYLQRCSSVPNYLQEAQCRHYNRLGKTQIK